MTQTNADHEDLTLEEAQDRFRHLAETQRDRSLWFMNPSIPIDIRRADADRILDQIARTSSRSAWMEVRRLKKWRLQHIR